MDLAFQRSKIKSWGFGGPIRLRISKTKELLVDHWLVFGEIIHDESGENIVKFPEIQFDIDSYKILRGFISNNPGMVKDYSQ